MSGLITIGEDKFGAFTIERDNIQEREQCIACGMPMPIKLEYISEPQLPEGIQVRDTILKSSDPSAAIGITCGCYAKFHRQVVHIEERMKQRANQGK